MSLCYIFLFDIWFFTKQTSQFFPFKWVKTKTWFGAVTVLQQGAVMGAALQWFLGWWPFFFFPFLL